jgi:hypothetical protein
MTPMEYADEYFRLNFERQADLARKGQQLRPLEEEIAICKQMIVKIVQAAIEEEREACAGIAHEELEIEREFAESRSGEEVAEYIEARIRARSS